VCCASSPGSARPRSSGPQGGAGPEPGLAFAPLSRERPRWPSRDLWVAWTRVPKGAMMEVTATPAPAWVGLFPCLLAGALFLEYSGSRKGRALQLEPPAAHCVCVGCFGDPVLGTIGPYWPPSCQSQPPK
jgi:hypothetical protein